MHILSVMKRKICAVLGSCAQNLVVFVYFWVVAALLQANARSKDLNTSHAPNEAHSFHTAFVCCPSYLVFPYSQFFTAVKYGQERISTRTGEVQGKSFALAILPILGG